MSKFHKKASIWHIRRCRSPFWEPFFCCFVIVWQEPFLPPYEIPVGILMSVIGGPFFVWLLIRKKGGHGQ